MGKSPYMKRFLSKQDNPKIEFKPKRTSCSINSVHNTCNRIKFGPILRLNYKIIN